MTLKDTVDGMLSDDYEERLRAEYQQLQIRLNGLNTFISNYVLGLLPFKPKTPVEVFINQRRAMLSYLSTLQDRICYENIEIKEVYK